jgi:hypothetical protein
MSNNDSFRYLLASLIHSRRFRLTLQVYMSLVDERKKFSLEIIRQ